MSLHTPIEAETVQGPLSGLVALVTGAADGVGAAIALHLGALGAAVTVADHREAGGRATADALETAGVDAQFVHLDDNDPLSWDAAVFDTMAGAGGFDILVNTTAGTPASARLGTAAAVATMRPDGAAGNGGLIVNVTAEETPADNPGERAAAKTTDGRLTGLEWRHRGHRITITRVASVGKPDDAATRLDGANVATGSEAAPATYTAPGQTEATQTAAARRIAAAIATLSREAATSPTA